MALPDPQPGLVIQFAYLWRDEARRGQEEGRKDRPCVVVLSVQDQDGALIVTVAPITHSSPHEPADGLTLPPMTKRRLGLDDQPSWIVSTELNRFRWPGPDLRPISRNRPGIFAYGFIPAALLKLLRAQIVARGRVAVVGRP